MRIETKILDTEYEEKVEMAYFGDYISLDAKNAVNSAKQNIASQADNDYFDGRVTFWVNGELFFEEKTTDLSGLWLNLISFKENMNDKGMTEVCSLDSLRTLFIIETPVGYQLKYQDAHYTFNDRDELIHSEPFTVESKQIEKEKFEQAIRKGFKEYHNFVVKNKLPISSYQLEQLIKQKI
ncbi:hypothetical protein [Peribacillus asahii]|uniref:hypothetical protein n=1 Tax=Peribacillus asahii TaxID=228899 RepID=UPI00381CCCEC